MKKTLFIITLFMPLLLSAQTDKVWLIKTGKLFDSESAQFKTGLDILVKNGRIEDVKPDTQVTDEERKSYTLIDLSKHTVMPGLIDAHTHLLYREARVRNMDFTTLALEKHLTMEGDAYRALYGAARAKGYLEAGITAVQDLGNSGLYADISLRNAIAEGLVTGPRMSCSGPGLAAAGAQMPGLNFPSQHIVDGEYRIVSGVEDAVQAVREHINQGVTVIKLYADNRPNRTMLSIDEMRAVVTEAHRYNVRVTAHATFDQSIHNAVVAGVDGIEHGYNVSDSTLMLMAKKHVFLVPTDGDRESMLKDNPNGTAMADRYFKRMSDRLMRAIKAGVPIALGSDDYAESKNPYGEQSKHNLIGYHDDGVPIPQVLQIGTFNAAQQIGRNRDLGVLKKGFLADIIAVDKSIETDIHAVLNVRFVMKGGVIYKNMAVL